MTFSACKPSGYSLWIASIISGMPEAAGNHALKANLHASLLRSAVRMSYQPLSLTAQQGFSGKLYPSAIRSSRKFRSSASSTYLHLVFAEDAEMGASIRFRLEVSAVQLHVSPSQLKKPPGDSPLSFFAVKPSQTTKNLSSNSWGKYQLKHSDPCRTAPHPAVFPARAPTISYDVWSPYPNFGNLGWKLVRDMIFNQLLVQELVPCLSISLQPFRHHFIMSKSFCVSGA
mmetsp:Transcript_38907/g.70170  ORF Transcript_38907/g.70170 Transcript_38907/m.70170 type:complete len:229 (+) Transcript_38907:237-923(+)